MSLLRACSADSYPYTSWWKFSQRSMVSAINSWSLNRYSKNSAVLSDILLSLVLMLI